MTVGILIITHDGLGSSMIETTISMLEVCPLQMDVINVPRNCDPEGVLRLAENKVISLDDGDGVLVLTDIFGSTPGNIASRLNCRTRIRTVTGINLPMLVRILNYPSLSLEELAEKAITGGRDGVILCKPADGGGSTD